MPQDFLILVKAVLYLLGVNVSENMIRNLSLTLEDTAESANKDSLLPEKIVLLIGQSLLSFN